jgi:hypothetical protein
MIISRIALRPVRTFLRRSPKRETGRPVAAPFHDFSQLLALAVLLCLQDSPYDAAEPRMRMP